MNGLQRSNSQIRKGFLLLHKAAEQMKLKKVATLALMIFCITVFFLNNYERQRNVEHDSAQRLASMSPNPTLQGEASSTHNHRVRDMSTVPAGLAIYKCNQPGVIALTFDDGPSPVTSAILDTLKAKAAHATFYVGGKSNGVVGFTSRIAMVRRAYAEGHMIGIHDTTHADMTTLFAAELTSHMTTMKSLIEAAIGKTPRYMRCPYGYYNDKVLSVLAAQNLRHTHWTMDPRDWEDRDTAATLSKIDKFLDTVTTSSPGSIILLHDVHDETAAAVSPIIDKVCAKGLRLVTVAECMNDKDGAYIA